MNKPTRLRFHDPRQAPFEVTGLNWFPEEHAWRRIPLEPPEPLSDGVATLSWNLAGARIRFRSDSRVVAVRVKLAGTAVMDHFPRTGSHGIDLYVGEAGHEVFRAVATAAEDEFTATLFEAEQRAPRTFLLHLPLYERMDSLEIGLEADVSPEVPQPTPLIDRPVVVYGTSITQGGCASRPGMAWTNIVARRLKRHFLNFGFSGNGKGEPEMARLLAQVKTPAAFLLLHEWNCARTFRERTTPFVNILRAAHPQTPIALVTGYSTPRTWWMRPQNHEFPLNLEYARRLVAERRAAGDKRLFFIDGREFLAPDLWEGTVDGVHATDLGFQRVADAMLPVIKQLLRLS